MGLLDGFRRVRLSDGTVRSWRTVRHAAKRERERRKRVKAAHPELFEEVREILTRHDPIKITVEDVNPDEYEPEVGTILPRLSEARSAPEVRRIIYEEFERWFSSDVAGKENDYDGMAVEVWAAWKRFRP